jgi:branched-chain amino acid transport system permease protein
LSGLPQIVFFGVDLVVFGTGFLNFYALYLAISLTLNLEFGYGGIPNFGKVMFIAGGAAFAGSVSGRLAAYVLGVGSGQDFIVKNTTIVLEINTLLLKNPVFVVEMVLVSIAIAAIIGGLFGYLASYPAIRLREDYLGIVLLGSAQFWQVIMQTYEPLIGGVQNVNVPDPYVFFITLGRGYRDLAAAVVMSIFAILVFVYAERVARSPLGRTLRAVRDNEEASRALGKDDAIIRRNMLIVASALAGVAGGLFTFYIASAEYDLWSRLTWTFWPFLIVIIGGAGNNRGVALGTLFFAAITKGLEQSKPYISPYIFFDVNWLQDILFAALFVVILLVRPEGILREKPTSTLSKRKLAGIIGIGAGGAGSQETEPAPAKGRFSRLIGRRGKESHESSAGPSG